MPEEFDFLNSDVVKERKEEIVRTESKEEKMRLIKELFLLIRENTESIVKQMDEGVSIANFDEVKVAMHNEFKKQTKALLKSLDGMGLTNKELGDIILAVAKENDRVHEEQFDTIKIRRPKFNDVNINNIDEINFPKEISVNNLSEVVKAVEQLKGALKVDAPKVNVSPPQVTVKAPSIPKISVPQPKVTVQPARVDLDPILDELQAVTAVLKSMKKGKGKSSTSIPDGISQQLDQLIQVSSRKGFPGKIDLAKSAEVNIKPEKTVVSGTKTITTAGTAEQVTATKTACDYVLVSADLGNANPVVVGDSSVVAANGSQQGIVLVPGNSPVRIDISDLSSLWVDSQTNGDELCYAYFR